MGNHLFLVRFPDGKIRMGHYQSTAMIGGPLLSDTYEEWKKSFSGPTPKEDANLPLVEVEFAVFYGGDWHGKTWARGQHLAAHLHDGLEDGLGPATEQDVKKGLPEWAKQWEEK